MDSAPCSPMSPNPMCWLNRIQSTAWSSNMCIFIGMFSPGNVARKCAMKVAMACSKWWLQIQCIILHWDMMCCISYLDHYIQLPTHNSDYRWNGTWQTVRKSAWMFQLPVLLPARGQGLLSEPQQLCMMITFPGLCAMSVSYLLYDQCLHAYYVMYLKCLVYVVSHKCTTMVVLATYAKRL